MRAPLAIAALAVGVVLLAGCAGEPGQGDQGGLVEVRIGALQVRAELAVTAPERAQGLSGRPSMAKDRGMLFVFPREGRHAFWMKDMRFPLDFVWISGDRLVVDLTADVPPPNEDLGEAALPLYRPAEPVLYVLELNAGLIAETGVQVGERVVIEGELPAAS